MPANRFMVIKGKELLKTIVFAILGVIIIVGLIYVVVGKLTNTVALYNPGVYTSEIALEKGNMKVEVKVDKRKIMAVNIVDQSESIPVFYPLFETVGEEIAERVVEEQTADIALTGENDVTASLILEAVGSSLAQARK